jgi:FkbM family methyltransferase
MLQRVTVLSMVLHEAIGNLVRTVLRICRHQSRGWIRASANPIRNFTGMELATISWGSDRATNTEVRVESAAGPLFSRSGVSGCAETGPWLRDGLRFVLRDLSGDTAEGDCTLATLTLRTTGTATPANLTALGLRRPFGIETTSPNRETPVMRTPRGTISATPNPIPRMGPWPSRTTIAWTSEHADALEVHIDAPDGPLFSRSGPSGSATTGNWVIDGMTFFLQNVTDGRPLTTDHTIARISITFTSVGELALEESTRLRALARFEPTTTTLLGGPFHVLDGPSFVYMHREIVEESIYYFEPQTDAPYIIDGGANIGVSVLSFKHLYPRARIVAFEPDEAAFAILEQNAQARGLGDVTLVKAALAETDGTAAFIHEGSYASRIASAGDSATNEVRTVRLRSVLDRPVDLLKLNIEGAETAVLADCVDLLDRVERIVLEYHSFASQPQLLHKLLGVLVDAGYRTYVRSSRTAFMHPLVKFQVQSGMDCQLYVYAVRSRSGADA